MAQVGNNENRFGGRFMIQDCDHMSEIKEVAQSGSGRQAEQSQTGGRQQGGSDENAGSQQGGERHRKGR